MLSKLPRWVGVAGFLLACAAGTMNSFMLLCLIRLPVSHLSGTTTNLAISIARGNLSAAGHFFMLLLSFVGGSALSGMIIRDSHLKLGRRYGYTLATEAILLFLVWATFDYHPFESQYLISFACGLQNAMATTYSGAVVRTTHVTGIFTDLGILLGNRLSGIKIPRKKLKLFAALLLGFLAGGVAGGFFFPRIGKDVLLLPILISSTLAIAYFRYWINTHGFERFFHRSVIS